MIQFECQNCAKRLSVRDEFSGREGRCSCGAVICIPSVPTAPRANVHSTDAMPDASSSQAPLVAQSDPFTWYEKSVVFGGVLLALTLVAYFFIWRDTWEEEHRATLRSLKAAAEICVRANDVENADAKYEEMFRLLGNHVPKDVNLRDEVEAAMAARREISKKAGAIRQARAARDRQQHPATTPAPPGGGLVRDDVFYDSTRDLPFKANDQSRHLTRDAAILALAIQFGRDPSWVEANMGSTNDLKAIHASLGQAWVRTGGGDSSGLDIGHVNYALVETLKSSWRREGWKYKPRHEQAAAIALMQAVINTDCRNPPDREATMDFVQKSIDSW